MTLLDTRGLLCPLPLLKLKQALSKMTVGESITVMASDIGSTRDFPAYIQQSGHRLQEQREANHEYLFVIQKLV